MNRWSALIFFFLIFFLSAHMSYGAAILYRVQQHKRMRQGRPTQEEYRQHHLAEQSESGQPQQEAAPLTYAQKIALRNQAITRAIANAHDKSVVLDSQPEISNSAAHQTQPTAQPQLAAVSNVTQNTDVKDVVDLSAVWKKLDKKSMVWMLLIDEQAKALTVAEYIDRFRKQGININQRPLEYVQMIDQMAAQSPQMLQRPFGELLQMMAIIDYDFDNGVDKDVLAKHVLGQAGYEANKKRFSR